MLQTPPHNKKQCRIHATNQSSSTSTKAQQNTLVAQLQGYEEMNLNYFKWIWKVWSMTECATLSSSGTERKKPTYKGTR